ncbi:MAG: hypothetical protein HY651_06870 [Acidobacteria bacterium]|nr:hypothetical protein [Acidobacteriota bacterium]
MSSAFESWASLGSYLPSVKTQFVRLREQHFAERFWAKDPTLWSDDPVVCRVISNRLGWLSVLPSMREDCRILRAFTDEVRLAGFTHALLLGMGGSSLSPEVCRRTFGTAPGFLDLAVLDSTDPAAVRSAERRAPLEKTLFLVATKSGTTTETLCFYHYFFEKARQRAGSRAGELFVAITDHGSPLVSMAAEKRFRRTFLNPSDIGGRYSALSYFGLLPAALLGIDIETLVDRAATLLPGAENAAQAEENPAILLGIALAQLGLHGRDKITFHLSPEIAAFGCWVEQLVAESTGKQGKGLIPVDGEPLGKPRSYGSDRAFVHMALRPLRDSGASRQLVAIEKAGHPVLRLELADKLDLGKEFFRWEIATAVAAACWKINAFDEPNVKESKDNTERLLQKLVGRGRFALERPAARDSGVRLYGGLPPAASAKGDSLRKSTSGSRVRDLLIAHLRRAQAGDYLAILAYLAPTPAIDQALERLRRSLRDGLGIATSLGYGPRYLHSTGQLHKGGPANGLFLEITAEDSTDLTIPSLPYGFSLLKQAQARGDQEALEFRPRRFLRLHLETKAESALPRIVRWVERAFPPRSFLRRPKHSVRDPIAL